MCSPKCVGCVPRNDLSVEFLDRLAHAELLTEALAHRIRRISIANVRVLDGPLYPLHDMLGLVDTGKYGFGGGIHGRFAAEQHQFLLSDEMF